MFSFFLFRRKKDHGRAEALLIAAWALGVRAAPCMIMSTDNEEDNEISLVVR